MELSDTVSLMSSTSYQDNFLAEYYQARIRVEELKTIIENKENGKNYGKKYTNISVLKHKLAILVQYMRILEQQAKCDKLEF